MDPNQQQLLLTSGGKKDPTYIDDVFNVEAYKGTAQNGQQHVNGIDLAGEGGMLWVKDRTAANNHVLFDTERGATKMLRLGDTTAGEEVVGSGVFESFNSDGWTSGSWGGIGHLNNYGAWTFRNQDGFFKVVKWTGNGVSGRQIAHGLGSTPGFVMTKALDNSDGWRTLHRWDFSKMVYISNDLISGGSSSAFNGSVCDATHLTVTADGAINANGQDYIAYVFAGGPSANTEHSVNLDGTGDYLSVGPSTDFSFGTGDFTIEGWFKKDDTSQGGFWQVSTTSGGLGAGSAPACAWTASAWQMYGGGDNTNPNPYVLANKWYHIAQVRLSGVTTMYVDGQPVLTKTDTTNYSGTYIAIGGYYATPYLHEGKISNFRVVKGTAVYTSSFRPQHKVLENISGTVLLCCNQSTTTGSTVTPGTITANGNPTASTDSPDFVDSESFKFGEEGNQNLISCGSYTGNTSVSPIINCGWEPQFIIIKCTSQGTTNWSMFDNIRGIVTGGNENYLYPNLANTEYHADRLELTPTGFKVQTGGGVLTNVNGGNYIYVAIRRPDGYVGKPVEAGTDAFAMDTGNSSSTIPVFDSPFPVDWALERQPASTENWYSPTRMTGEQYVLLNSSSGSSSSSNMVWDSNVGWSKDAAPSNYQSWMWKRGAGFDVVAYVGNGNNTDGENSFNHSLAQTPEMIWIKGMSGGSYSGNLNWTVSHKDLNDGTNPWQYTMMINNSNAESTTSNFGNTAPTSTHFFVGNDSNGRSNDNNTQYICYLFSSVAGISKVGSYTGSSYDVTINLGFTPRFLIVKAYNPASGSQRWNMFDSLRGMGAGSNDKRIYLDATDGQQTGDYITSVSATGITMKTGFSYSNTNGNKYIYYAHA